MTIIHMFFTFFLIDLIKRPLVADITYCLFRFLPSTSLFGTIEIVTFGMIEIMCSNRKM